MKILIAPQAFKGTLSPFEAAYAIESGVKRAMPQAETILLPIADGGDGSIEVILHRNKGKKIEAYLTNALGARQATQYAILDNNIAIIEIASICGLAQIPAPLHNPAIATSYGVGEAILDALDRNARRFLICLGGSATNDGGTGMLQALGCRFLDSSGKELPPGGESLGHLRKIDIAGMDPRLKGASFQAACDVSNPLLGPEGASKIYAAQKGASPELIEKLEHSMQNYAAVIKKDFGIDVGTMSFAGAAGGIASALYGFLHAELRSGTQIIFELIWLEKDVEKADLIITGEGRIDGQTLYEKGICALAKLAVKHRKPVIALAGSLGPGYTNLHKVGVGAMIPISFAPLVEVPARSSELLADAAEQAMRLYRKGIPL